MPKFIVVLTEEKGKMSKKKTIPILPH